MKWFHHSKQSIVILKAHLRSGFIIVNSLLSFLRDYYMIPEGCLSTEES